MKAFILCGGEGKRLGMKTPKPLIKVGGRAIIDHIIFLLEAHGITEIAINLHYKPAEFILHFCSRRIYYTFEPTLLGTAGTLIKAASWLGKNFIVINGDTISDIDLTLLIAIHKTSKNIATIFTHDTAIHNGGVFIFEERIFQFIPQNRPYSIHEDLLPDLIKKKIPITLYKSNATYFDCSTPEKLAKARRFFGE